MWQRSETKISPYYFFNLHPEYILRETRLEKDECGFRIGGRNINSLSYSDDATLRKQLKMQMISLHSVFSCDTLWK